MQTPVIFAIFNRPEPTRRVFEEIAKAKPPVLFVVADGPRTEAEAELCRQTREIATAVTWPCEVKTNFSEVNLGCRRRVSSGISWAFDQCEEAIVLEDDCVPAASFFTFCEEMLARYRDDQRIMFVCGSNYLKGKMPGRESYYFSYYPHCWGWATWKRSWQVYDVEMKEWPNNTDLPIRTTGHPDEAALFNMIFQRVHDHIIESWAYQLYYTLWMHGGLAIRPMVNLISNIGHGEGATHTNTADHPYAALPTSEIHQIIHPKRVVRDRKRDWYEFRTFLDGDERLENRLWHMRARRKARVLWKKLTDAFHAAAKPTEGTKSK